MTSAIKNLLGGILILLLFYIAVYFAIFYSPSPALATGIATGWPGDDENYAAWLASADWPTSERVRRAKTIIIVSFEKNWLGYYRAVVNDVLKSADKSEDLPEEGREFKYASFQKADSDDYGDGAVYFFYDKSQPIQEEHIYFSAGILRDEEGTELSLLGALLSNGRPDD